MRGKLSIIIHGQWYTTGDHVVCYINNEYIESARIYVKSDEIIYICQNKMDGDSSPDKLGYIYSWASFYRDGILSDNITGLSKAINCEKKESCSISADFIRFLQINNLQQIATTLAHKIGIFDEFIEFSISETSGLIQLSSINKKMDLKFGRFIKKIIDRYNEIIPTSKMEISDKWIENIHNKYVSFQSNGQLKIEFLVGQDILSGYNPSNYLESPIGSLHKSCMSGRGEWLNLYTENPNQVGLAVIYINDKIAARALTWITNTGEKYIDRAYVTYDWLFSYIDTKSKELGYRPIDNTEKTIQLEKWNFSNYPYVDSFYLLNKEKGTLHHGPKFYTRDYHVLKAANGNFSSVPNIPF